MADRPPIDLVSCDTEPIHIIGTVQPHGALVSADADTLVIMHASANSATYLGIPHDALIGRHLRDVFGVEEVEALMLRPLTPQGPDLLRPWFVDLNGQTLECFPHIHGGRLVLEFVRPNLSPAQVWEEDLLRQRIISELIKPDTLPALARVSAEIIREVTGFDRVMIYRFAEDKHGEVIAESTSRSDSFLGLHYPASDIPDPARKHFLLNLIRAIPDINAVPVPIYAAGGEKAGVEARDPLDLTYSKLRGVAPVHIEYLNNMGVQASMSISLTANDRLWGLVACHHYAPHEVPWSTLRFCELIGGTMSALLQSLENTAKLRRSIEAERQAHAIERDARKGEPLAEIVRRESAALMALVGAKGMVLEIGERRVPVGIVPQPLPDMTPLRHLAMDGLATTDTLNQYGALSAEQMHNAAGAAVLELSEDGQDSVIFFREEFEDTINWAGKPEKIEHRDATGSVRLSPRGSFDLWREERRGQSEPFTDSDRDVLRIIRRCLFALNSLDRERAAIAAQREAEAEESRLRVLLLDETRRSSMGELASALAHELNQPLSAVTNYLNACRQELANYSIVVPTEILTLIDNAVAESSRAGNLVRRLRNFVAQGELVSEKIDLHEIVRQALQLALDSSRDPMPELRLDFDDRVPAVWADPIQIGQVVLNLARNSLAAMRDQRVRRLHVKTSLLDGEVSVSIRDTGVGVPAENVRELFQPFHSSTTRGMGIGLSLSRSIIDAHGGRIWLEPVDSGAELVFTLPLEPGTRHG